MPRFSLDSNILIYATLEPQTVKGQRANDIIVRASPNGILAAQALLEFVTVIRRRAPALTLQAIAQAEAWANVFETAPTTNLVLRQALSLVRAHSFQVWDAVICAASQEAGAVALLSEDMQDGFTWNGMRIVNPLHKTQNELEALFS